MKYKIVATDFDGTLLNSRKEISERNHLALQHAHDTGVITVAATGRYLHATKGYYDISIFDYLILNNGAAIYDVKNEETIHLPGVSTTAVTELTKHFRPFSARIDYYSLSKHYILVIDNVEILPHWQKISDPSEIPEDITRINIVMNKESDTLETFIRERDFVSENFPELRAVIMSDTDINPDFKWLGIQNEGTNKLSGIKTLATKLNIPMNDVIFFGDSANDLPVYGHVGCSVAMGNALPEIKERADLIAPSNDADGLAEVLEKVFVV